MWLRGFVQWRWVLALGLIVVVVGSGLTWKALAGGHHYTSDDAVFLDEEPDAAAKVHLEAAFGQLPLHFEAHTGQSDDRVEFLTRGRGYTLLLKPSEMILALQPSGLDQQTPFPASQAPRLLRMRLLGAAADPLIEGLDPLPGKSNYFIGNDPKLWRTNIPTYASVRYQGVYPNIDLLYHGNHSSVEFDFVVAPGGNTEAIRLAVEGIDEARIDSAGNLLLGPEGQLRLRAPSIYQEVDGEKHAVSGAYALHSSEAAGQRPPRPIEVGFSVGGYDAGRPLIIDPVLEYSTYLGWAGGDAATDIILDADGNVYLTGRTNSPADPSVGVFVGFGGGRDAFVVKLDPTGSILEYVTFFGGSGDDTPGGITMILPDIVVVAGHTDSTDLPNVENGFSKFYRGNTDGFVVKLNFDGSDISYATYLGGTGQDIIADVTAELGTDIVYVVGSTSSGDFPVKNELNQVGGFLSGSKDAFVAKLDLNSSNPEVNCYIQPDNYNDCADLLSSTYLGGSSVDDGFGIARNGENSVYVTGQTCSTDFPKTAGVFDNSANGGCDAFFTSLSLPPIAPIVLSRDCPDQTDSSNHVTLWDGSNYKRAA